MRWLLLTVLLLAFILVPFVLFEEWFERLATGIMRGELAGWPAVALIGGFLSLDVFLPVPSSIISTAAGAVLGFGRGMAVIWAGMTAGCVLAYLLGARATGVARRIIGRDGLDRAERVAATHGDWALVVCRPVPVLAEASVILAGLVHTPWRRFLLLTAAANLGIAAAYAAIGAFSMTVGSFLLTFVGALTIPALAMLAARLWLGGSKGR
jgi:uncharacterized membrane protein YdjX (TVP38/TMEM64 family)